jgi:hypothetical protein
MAIEINGLAYTWSDHEFSCIVEGTARTVLPRITAVNFDHRVAIANVYGAGRYPVDQSVGTYTVAESTMTFLKKGWQSLLAILPDRWMATQFTLLVSARNATEPLVTYEIQGRLMSEVVGLTQGDDATTQDVGIMPSLVKRNGLIVGPADEIV